MSPLREIGLPTPEEVAQINFEQVTTSQKGQIRVPEEVVNTARQIIEIMNSNPEGTAVIRYDYYGEASHSRDRLRKITQKLVADKIIGTQIKEVYGDDGSLTGVNLFIFYREPSDSADNI